MKVTLKHLTTIGMTALARYEASNPEGGIQGPCSPRHLAMGIVLNMNNDAALKLFPSPQLHYRFRMH
jgi:hypothetical protein